MDILNSKRFLMTFVVVLLWLAFGLAESFIPAVPDYISLAAYYASLTGLVGSYLWGESVRQSDGTTPIFMKGKNSRREVLVYIAILCWTVMGVVSKIFLLNLVHVSAYYAALTPFVSGYILATTYKPISDEGRKRDDSGQCMPK